MAGKGPENPVEIIEKVLVRLELGRSRIKGESMYERPGGVEKVIRDYRRVVDEGYIEGVRRGVALAVGIFGGLETDYRVELPSGKVIDLSRDHEKGRERIQAGKNPGIII